ncbi:LL-diaminopimelate aminotransferase [Virgibacillus necropolis]|uniref:LL-diaminopimelate aminotransferase n=1 Tax=Virgibacillus necropolis TaxID=163877 RepID=A0A221MEK9_9BACI|nr:LL-diaminopimelate aminotransferase [Virgibacillus necropolis]ASN06064.1 LL-diaminopimelate aminotransferase [Virgibacillus necropolis]
MKYKSNRLSNVPPYKFAEVQKMKKEALEAGVDVIDLGVGDPDLPTPKHIVNKLVEELQDPANLKYPSFAGSPEFREAVAAFYQKTYDVKLDPDTEVLALIGSKEGIGHLLPAVIDPGDYVLGPDPGYPVYRMATLLADGEYHNMSLEAAHGFKPNFDEIPNDILEKAKVMFLNYPSNPTGATVGIDVYERAIEFARKHKILVVTDSAYNMVTYNNYKSPSIMQVDGSKEFAVEFGSLSKAYCMTGWRIGYVVGNKEVIKSLSIYKSNVDTGVFTPIQKAAAHALTGDQSSVTEYNQVYKERMETMVAALQSIGIGTKPIHAGFFIWAPVPDGYTSEQFVATVLEQTGVIFTPGNIFGPGGEGYFRVSFSVPNERIQEAVERIREKLVIGS